MVYFALAILILYLYIVGVGIAYHLWKEVSQYNNHRKLRGKNLAGVVFWPILGAKCAWHYLFVYDHTPQSLEMPPFIRDLVNQILSERTESDNDEEDNENAKPSIN
jgi:hypothetical protein